MVWLISRNFVRPPARMARGRFDHPAGPGRLHAPSDWMAGRCSAERFCEQIIFQPHMFLPSFLCRPYPRPKSKSDSSKSDTLILLPLNCWAGESDHLAPGHGWTHLISDWKAGRCSAERFCEQIIFRPHIFLPSFLFRPYPKPKLESDSSKSDTLILLPLICRKGKVRSFGTRPWLDAPRFRLEGRKMFGRKILRADHFSASHFSAIVPLSSLPQAEARNQTVEIRHPDIAPMLAGREGPIIWHPARVGRHTRFRLEGRKMFGRKILRAEHFSASHFSAIVPLSSQCLKR